MKAILFDLDGTLLNTREFICQAVEHAMLSSGLKVPNREEFSKFVGMDFEEFYQKIAPNYDYRLLCESHHNFQMKNFHLIQVFPNTHKTLRNLKKRNIKLAVVTSRMSNTKEVLISSKLIEYFDIVISGDDVKNLKPHPEPIHLALEKLKLKNDQVLMVGDSEFDILAGIAAGVKTVGVTHGFLGKDIKKLNPDYVIDNIEELMDII